VKPKSFFIVPGTALNFEIATTQLKYIKKMSVDAEEDGDVWEMVFQSRKEAVDYLMERFGRNKNKSLRKSDPTNKNNRGCNNFILTCKGCNKFILCGKVTSRVAATKIFNLDAERSTLEHAVIAQDGSTLPCIGTYKATIKDVLQCPAFVAIKNSTSNIKYNKRTGSSNKALVQSLQAAGVHNATRNVIQIAGARFNISPKEYIQSYDDLIPYLRAVEAVNPEFKYIVQKSELHVFNRMVCLMPLSKQALPHCFQVVGLDTAFGKKY
jgi:hypothetical protein